MSKYELIKDICESCVNSTKIGNMHLCKMHEAYVSPTYKCGWYCRRLEKEHD